MGVLLSDEYEEGCIRSRTPACGLKALRPLIANRSRRIGYGGLPKQAPYKHTLGEIRYADASIAQLRTNVLEKSRNTN